MHSYYVAHVDDSWDKFPCLLDDEGVDYSCKDLHDGCKVIERI